VPGVFFEIGGDCLDRCSEVGRDGNLHFIRLNSADGEYRKQGGQAGRGKT